MGCREEIRAHGTDAEKRARLVGELSTLVQGHMHDVIFRHDAARVIQCLIQFGTAEQRAAVYAELSEHWLDLMKSTYGKFVVTKMLVYGTKEQKAGIMAAMHGHVRKLIKHQEAATYAFTAPVAC
jgi:pumilio family protein 6